MQNVSLLARLSSLLLHIFWQEREFPVRLILFPKSNRSRQKKSSGTIGDYLFYSLSLEISKRGNHRK